MIPKLMGSEVEYNVHLVFFPEAPNAHDDTDIVDNLVTRLLVERGSATGAAGTAHTSHRILRWFNWWKIRSDRENATDHVRQVGQRLGLSGWRLSNGARFYLDNVFPEYSTPECISVRDLVAYEKAGERVMRESARKLEEDSGIRTKIFKKNSDRHGASYACHENYLLTRKFFNELVRPYNWGVVTWIFTTFLATRIIFTGSGKVGSDIPGEDVEYQLSQRADFIRTFASHYTTCDRPIMNLRDISYADNRRYGRLHVITGDSNMSETSIFLKMGTTALVLAMLEDGWVTRRLSKYAVKDPVSAIRIVSRDLALRQKLATIEGAEASALEIQYGFLDSVLEWYERKYVLEHGANPEYGEVIEMWTRKLGTLGRDPSELADNLDCWVKKRLVEGVLEEAGYSLGDIATNDEAYDLALSTDFLYHSLDETESHYAALLADGFMTRMLDPHEVERALDEPPADTRAFLRSALVTHLGQFENAKIYAAWHGVHANVQVSGRRMSFGVHLPDPLKGIAAETGKVFEDDPSFAQIEARIKEVYSP